MSINRVIISGNLTRDPELRSTAGGMPVLGFGVAVNDRRKNQQTGEWEDYPNFIDCTMFGARAEALSRYLSKGTKVSIEGKPAGASGSAKGRSAARSRSSWTSWSSCRAAATRRRTAAAWGAATPRRPRRLLRTRPHPHR